MLIIVSNNIQLSSLKTLYICNKLLLFKIIKNGNYSKRHKKLDMNTLYICRYDMQFEKSQNIYVVYYKTVNK